MLRAEVAEVFDAYDGQVRAGLLKLRQLILAAARPGSDHDYAMFFICHTHLVERFAGIFGEVFAYDGNRAILFHTATRFRWTSYANVWPWRSHTI